jgi:acyl dehydratase
MSLPGLRRGEPTAPVCLSQERKSMEENLLCFDDLKVGDKFASGTHEVHADDIKRFASEFDPQPFHLDNDPARDTLFLRGSQPAAGIPLRSPCGCW